MDLIKNCQLIPQVAFHNPPKLVILGAPTNISQKCEVHPHQLYKQQYLEVHK